MTILLAWLIANALVLALLLSQAKPIVLAAAGLLLMAAWFAFAGAAWLVLSPLFAGRIALRRLGLVVAR